MLRYAYSHIPFVWPLKCTTSVVVSLYAWSLPMMKIIWRRICRRYISSYITMPAFVFMRYAMRKNIYMSDTIGTRCQIHRRVTGGIPSHKGPATRKIFLFGNVIILNLAHPLESAHKDGISTIRVIFLTIETIVSIEKFNERSVFLVLTILSGDVVWYIQQGLYSVSRFIALSVFQFLLCIHNSLISPMGIHVLWPIY